MHKTRVGVLRGGPSNEYEVSLKTGGTVLNHLQKGNLSDKYQCRDILIDRDGLWHMHGLPVKPHDALTHLDVVFNALHGHYGEDGKVQHILEIHQIPFTGSGSFASAVGMNKYLSKEIYKRHKIKTPQSKIINKIENIRDKILELFKAFSLPFIIKPVSGGSSIGVTLAKDFDSFKKGVELVLEHNDSVLIEEFIIGREATCGVIDGFRDQLYYALPPIEIKPHSSKFFDYEAKYQGKSDKIVPGNFSSEEKSEIERLAIEAHKALGLRHYSRSDFIVHPRRGVFILETNTLPGLTEESLLPKALNSVGASLPHLLDHVLELAMCQK